MNGVPDAAIDSSGAAHLALESVPCLLCGEDRFLTVYERCPDRLYSTGVTVNIVECKSCGLVQTNPRPDRKSISAVYPRDYISWISVAPSRAQRLRLGVWASLYAVSLVPYALRYGPRRRVPRPPWPGATALDVGSATGALLRRLRDRGWEVWGVEPGLATASASIVALGLDSDRIRATTVEEAHFPPETFDLITMSHVLEHLHDPLAALERVRPWLKPTGRLMIWCPNYNSYERRIFGRHWLGLDVPRHLFHFTPATLTALLRKVDFVPLEIVPEPQTATLSGSVALAFDAIRGQRGFSQPRLLHYALMPLGSLALAAGDGGHLAVTCAPASPTDASV